MKIYLTYFYFMPTYSKQIFIFEIKLNYNVAASCWARVQAEHHIIHDDEFGMILNLWGMRVGESSSGCNWICKHPLSYLNYISFNFHSTRPFSFKHTTPVSLQISSRASLFIHGHRILAFLDRRTRIPRDAMNAKGLYDKDNKE